jgi:hypothetical protein
MVQDGRWFPEKYMPRAPYMVWEGQGDMGIVVLFPHAGPFSSPLFIFNSKADASHSQSSRTVGLGTFSLAVGRNDRESDIVSYPS